MPGLRGAAPMNARQESEEIRRALISLAHKNLPFDEPEALGEIIATVLWHEKMDGGLSKNAGALKQELDQICERCRLRHDPEEIRKRDLAQLSALLTQYKSDPWVGQVFDSFYQARKAREQ